MGIRRVIQAIKFEAIAMKFIQRMLLMLALLALTACPFDLGDGQWPLQKKTVLNVAIEGSSCMYQKRAFDGDLFYLPGISRIILLGKDGKEKGSIPIDTEVKALSFDVDYPMVEFVTILSDHIFIGLTDGSLTNATWELQCFSLIDRSFKWKTMIANQEAEGFFHGPSLWNEYVFTVINPSEWSTIIRATPIDDPQAYIEREYEEQWCMNDSQSFVHDDMLWLNFRDFDLIRIDAASFVDPSMSNDECVNYRSLRLSETNVYDKGVYFFGDDYILRKHGGVERRHSADDSIVWSYPLANNGETFDYYGVSPWLVHGPSLVLTSSGGRVANLDTGNGNIRWASTTWPPNDTINNIDSSGCVIDGKWYAQYSSSYCTVSIFDLASGEKLLQFEGLFFDIAQDNLWSEGTRLYHASAHGFAVYDIYDTRAASLWPLLLAGIATVGGAAALILARRSHARRRDARRAAPRLPGLALSR